MAKLVLVRPSQWKESGHPMRNTLGKRYIFHSWGFSYLYCNSKWEIAEGWRKPKVDAFQICSWLCLYVCKSTNGLIHSHENKILHLECTLQIFVISIWKVIFVQCILAYIKSDYLAEILPPPPNLFQYLYELNISL